MLRESQPPTPSTALIQFHREGSDPRSRPCRDRVGIIFFFSSRRSPSILSLQICTLVFNHFHDAPHTAPLFSCSCIFARGCALLCCFFPHSPLVTRHFLLPLFSYICRHQIL